MNYPCITFDQSDNNGVYLNEEALADYDFEKRIKSDDRAASMELIMQLQGYAIGSGMFAITYDYRAQSKEKNFQKSRLSV